MFINPIVWKNITPIWFTWLGWFLALGAIGIVAEQTNSLSLNIIFGVSYVCFGMFMLYSISEILDLTLIKNKKLNFILSSILAITLLTLFTFGLQDAMNSLVFSRA